MRLWKEWQQGLPHKGKEQIKDRQVWYSQQIKMNSKKPKAESKSKTKLENKIMKTKIF